MSSVRSQTLPLICAALVFAPLAFAQSALAAPAVNEDAQRCAVESFDQAKKAFERAEFAAAAAAFEQAAECAPGRAVPILDAAEAWQDADEPVRAAEDCDRVLAIPNAEANFVNDAQDRLRSLAHKIATIDFAGPRTVNVKIDNGPEFNVPARRRLKPGHHTLILVDLTTLKTTKIDIDLVAASTRSIDVSSPAPPPKPPLDDSHKGDGSTPPAATINAGVPAATWVAYGVGAAAGIGAAIFGEITLHDQSTFNANPTADTRDAFHRDKAITNVAWGVLAAGAVAGTAIWIFVPKHQEISMGATVGGLVGRVRF